MEFKASNLQEEIEQTEEVELQDGTEFRNYLMNTLLNGFPRYQEELQDYYVQIIDNTTEQWRGTTAAVDAGLKIIYIAKVEKDKLTSPKLSVDQRQQAEDKMSLLIRHELLHSILEHQKRTFMFIARTKGWDPTDLDQDQYELVLALRARPDILFRRYNGGRGITAQNGAGDFELSKYYLERDVELTDSFGGLVLDDHPQWKNYSFEDIMVALRQERRQLYMRLFTTNYGKMDSAAREAGDKNAFKVRSAQASEFEKARTINPKDVTSVRLINLSEYAALSPQLQQLLCNVNDPRDYYGRYESGSWIDAPFVEKGKACYATNSVSGIYDAQAISMTDPATGQVVNLGLDFINKRHGVFAVVDVPNLDLYSNLNAGDTVRCLGKDMYVLPYKRGLLYPHKIQMCIFDSLQANKYYSNSLRNSVIKNVLEDWFDPLKAKYSGEQI